jgi:GT2 family glycosyltransferase
MSPPSSSPCVFVILVNWNGRADTLECLESLSGLDYPNSRIVVSDNASSDQSVEAVRREYPSATILANPENLGFAGGNNVGIRYALQQGADYVWLLNNDTILERNALSTLVQVAESDPAIGILGGKIYYYSDRDVLSFAGATIAWDKGRSPHIGRGESDRGQYDTVHDVDRVSGCSMLVRKDVCERVGLFDEDFFLYAEDVDWCVRAKIAGYRCVYVPASRIFHKEAASVKGKDGKSTLFLYYNTRNFLKLIRKHHRFPTGEYLIMKVIFRHLRYRKRGLLKMVLSGIDRSVLLEPEDKAIFLGIRDFLSNRMGRRDYSF